MSRASVLARIREAVAAGGATAPGVPRTYRRTGDLAPPEVLALFAERVRDYRAEVHDAGDPAAAVRTALGAAASVVLPPGLPPELAAAAGGRHVVVDGDPAVLSHAELDGIEAVVTTATLGVAVNGTVILDHGPGQGRRVVSLLPDLHVVVVRAADVVETLPEALSRLDPRRPLTIVAGPSATSDIELQRVEGVHGPRRLHVVLA